MNNDCFDKRSFTQDQAIISFQRLWRELHYEEVLYLEPSGSYDITATIVGMTKQQ